MVRGVERGVGERLPEWQRLGNATTSAPGQFEFRDGQATNFPTRFYRLVWP